MPITEVILSHIEKHEIIREEVLNVLNGFNYVKRKGKRYVFYGKTKAGRYLTVVVEKNKEYALVTERESTKSENVLYKKEESKMIDNEESEDKNGKGFRKSA
jgi:hypothetical protein